MKAVLSIASSGLGVVCRRSFSKFSLPKTSLSAFEIIKGAVKDRLRNPKSTVGLICDLDGTIIKSVEPHAISFKAALGSVGVEIDINQKNVLEKLNGPVRKTFERFIGYKGDRAVDYAVEIYRKEMDKHYPERSCLMPGAAETAAIIFALRSSDVLCLAAIGTYMDHDRARSTVKRLGIAESFDVIEGTQGEDDNKRTQKFIRRIFKGEIPSKVIVVGDGVHEHHPSKSSSDIKMAKNVPDGRGIIIGFGKPYGEPTGYTLESMPWFPNWSVGNRVILGAVKEAIDETKNDLPPLTQRKLRHLRNNLNAIRPR